MNTREILAKCARAMGVDQSEVERTLTPPEVERCAWCGFPPPKDLWNPLTSNDNCAEMCAQLMIDTLWDEETERVEAWTHDHVVGVYEYFKDHNNDRLAAWRHAACQVAAMMGERV